MTAETNQPTDSHAQPELKQVLGALLFAARKPITPNELCGVLVQAAQNGEDATRAFGKIQESDVRTAIEQLKVEFGAQKLGLILVEVAGGFRFQTDPAGGPWVRQLLNLDKPARLSKPALETLAIIAYRQPATRAEIEALRGVNVDAMMRHLLELQLIRIVGRSDLPGRPLMYGTTQLFLEHFGLNSVKNLPGIEQLSRREAERVRRQADAGRQMPDAGQEKKEDGIKTNTGLSTDSSTVALAKEDAPSEVEGANAERQKKEEANTDKEAAAGKDQEEEEETDGGSQTPDASPEGKDEKTDEDDEEEDEDEDEDEDEEGKE